MPFSPLNQEEIFASDLLGAGLNADTLDGLDASSFLRRDDHALPSVDNMFDIGQPTLKWRNIYADKINDYDFEKFLRSDRNNIPDFDSMFDLGSQTFRWRTIYAENINSTSFENFLRVDKHNIPSLTNTWDLGSMTNQWRVLYVNRIISSDQSYELTPNDFITVSAADERYVDVAGDTMTGSLEISNSSTNPSLIINNLNASSQGNCLIMRATNGSAPKIIFDKLDIKTWSFGASPYADNDLVIWENSSLTEWGTPRVTLKEAGDFIFHDSTGTEVIKLQTDGEIIGTALQARYADLAEKYTCSNPNIKIGTIVTVDENSEYNVCEYSFTPSKVHKVVGVISENPAYLMNSESDGVPVALTGKVKVRVIGPVRKGNGIQPAGNGVGISTAYLDCDCVIPELIFGIALESNLNSDEKLIECIIK